jgi:hypothetical protein
MLYLAPSVGALAAVVVFYFLTRKYGRIDPWL